MLKEPVPADPERDESRPDWEPVITRPDPMTAEEWQAWLDFDPAEDCGSGGVPGRRGLPVRPMRT